MFTVWLGTVLMLILLCSQVASQQSWTFTALIGLLLFFTVLFANFAEAIAEQRGKAQADSLRKTREETNANVVLSDGTFKTIPSSQLRKGDTFIVEAGELVPCDGEIIKGLATIDESAITGESAPVIREAGGDRSSVTGGTKVLSDRICVRSQQTQVQRSWIG